MTLADPEAAVRKLNEFLGEVDATFERWNSGTETSGIDRFQSVKELLPFVREIARRVDVGVVGWFEPVRKGWPWGPAREAAIRVRALIMAKDELAEMLGPTGPRLEASRLHPWVWSASSALWDDGHRRAALQAAGAQIETQLQAKLNRYDASGKQLVNETFKLEPAEAGRPRLRMPGFPTDSESYTSAQEGARSFGVGCMQGIRNIASHNMEEPEEAVALEQLAALSVFARWIDDAILETKR